MRSRPKIIQPPLSLAEDIFLTPDLASLLVPHLHADAFLPLTRVPRPTPLLGVSRRLRALYAAELATGVLTVRTPWLHYTLVPFVPGTPELPYAWRVTTHDGLLAATVHPCHLLWARTLRWGTLEALAEEARVVLYHVHDGSRSVRDLDALLRDDWGVGVRTLRETVRPLGDAMARMCQARDAYVRWHRRRGAMRLGCRVE